MRRFNRQWYCVSILACLVSGAGWAQPVRSVLKSGSWLKIGVTETGVIRLDYPTLTRANPAFATADPRLFRLYGNGGVPLPQPNAAARPVDLLENAVQVTGEADGRFDPADALFFFGQSTTKITVDAAGQPITHQLNPYADTTFYFLTIGTAAGLRVANRQAGNTTTGTPITTYADYVFHEAERVKPLASGRFWLGEAFQGELSQRQMVTLSTPGRIANAPVLIRSAVMASSTAQTTYFVQVNGSDIGSQTVEPVADALTRYTTRGMLNTSAFTTTPTGAGEGISIQLTSSRKGGAGSSGYLDFLSAQYQRELRQYDQPVLARTGAGRFVAKQATAALRILDVTSPLRPVQQAYALMGSEATWSSDSLARHDYVLFTDAKTGFPASVKAISNQDLHGQPMPNLLIVTPVAWQAEAERLAQFRRTNDSLSVLVVTTQQVYNEFSSGQPDPTAIRDICRYFYRQNPSRNPANGLQYLLLFGDATYDYRNIEQFLSPTEQANTVPVYESRESLHPLLSFSSDDYFGFLKDSDGEWAEDFTGDQRLDIGVGRLPVKSPDEAKTVVDKLIRYATDKTTLGNWRSQLLFVADDGDDNIHQRDADQLATYVETHALAYHPDRLFIDLFPRTADTVGTQVVPKSPLVNARIRQAMQAGRLIINYTGHGGIREWAQEQILTLKDILTTQTTRLPLFVTATCEFGRYDDPTSNSGAEIALLNPTGGGIGLLTTTRPVFADKNLLLNQAFYRTVFQPKAGRMPRLGDVIRATKDSSLAGVQNRNFTLLGDPSMRLAYPRAEVVLTTLNGHALTAPDTLRALQRVTLTGEVRQSGTGRALSDFSGTAQLTLYGKPTSLTTLGLEGNPKMAFRSYTNLLFSGQVRVLNGQFQVQVTLPKDLDLTVGPGRLYTYALRDDGLTDAGGATDLPIGGVASIPITDLQPPTIRLSLADTLATVPYLTVAGPTATLLVELADNEGINLSQSVKNHALMLQLDGREAVLLSPYYTATTSDGRRGLVRYPITGLANGTYTAHVSAYDLSNNAAEATLTFVVTDKPALAFGSLRAYPNPFSEKATIIAAHNRPGDDLDWSLAVFDATGKLLAEQQGQCTNCPNSLVLSGWDGRGSSGDLLVNDLYIYKLQARSVSDGSIATGSGKLLLMR